MSETRIAELIEEFETEKRLAADVMFDLCCMVDDSNVEQVFSKIPERIRPLFHRIAKSCASDREWLVLGTGCSCECPYTPEVQATLRRWHSNRNLTN